MYSAPSFQNLCVLILESRRAREMAALVTTHGGQAISAPSMREVPLESNSEALAFGERLFAGGVDILLLLTGVGTRTLVEALQTKYPRERILDGLKKTKIVCRGPKPVRALNEMGVPFEAAVPEPNTWRQVLETFDKLKDRLPVQGRRVAVQEYGASNPDLLEGLKERGAELIVVPVYRWALPEDTRLLEEAVRQIVDRKVDAALFTTSIQIDHALAVAARTRLEAKFKKALGRLVIGSIGPDCSETLRSHGLRVDFEASPPKMGVLVEMLAKRLG